MGVELHPWNTDFVWRDHTGPRRVLTAEQVHQFDTEGWLVLPEVFDADTVAALTAEIDELEARTEAFLRRQADERFSIAEAGAITFTVHVVTRSETARRVVHHPTLVGLCHDLVGPDVRLYWDQAVYKKPDKPRRFPWHQDNGYTYVEPQQYLTCWIALTDATADNGCPRVAPGLHRLGTLRHTYVDPLGWECLRNPDREVVAEVPAGGVVAFSSLTPHLTGPNTSGAVRKAYIVQYAPDGAVVCQGDPDAGPPTARVPADAPERQFPVLVGGEPVGIPAV